MGNNTQHSVTMVRLLLAMDQVATCIEDHEKNLAPVDKENLLASLGSLSCQADMLGYVETLPELTATQNSLMEKLRHDASKMIDLVKSSLSHLLPKAPGVNHG